jgi:hypothetical protein
MWDPWRLKPHGPPRPVTWIGLPITYRVNKFSTFSVIQIRARMGRKCVVTVLILQFLAFTWSREQDMAWVRNIWRYRRVSSRDAKKWIWLADSSIQTTCEIASIASWTSCAACLSTREAAIHASLPGYATESRRHHAKFPIVARIIHSGTTHTRKQKCWMFHLLLLTCKHPKYYETTGTPQTLNKTRELRRLLIPFRWHNQPEEEQDQSNTK